MNLLDAIESGGRFKRESFDDSLWCHVVPNTYDIPEVRFVNGEAFLPHVGDLCAEDWEVAEREVKVTRDTLLKAYMRAKEKKSFNSASMMFDSLLKELGL